MFLKVSAELSSLAGRVGITLVEKNVGEEAGVQPVSTHVGWTGEEGADKGKAHG